MIRCFSVGMPIPVSATSNAITDAALLSTGWSSLQPLPATDTRQLNAALFGELERVGKQILQDLLQAFGVGYETASKLRIAAHLENQMPVFRFVSEWPCHGVEQTGEEDFIRFDRYRARFDLGKIQNVADQVQQVCTGSVDGAGELHLLRRQVSIWIVSKLLAQTPGYC